MAKKPSGIKDSPQKARKGNKKVVDEKDTKDNPLLKIEDNVLFSIESGNFLNDPTIYTFPGFEAIDPQKPESIDLTRLDNNSEFVVILLYYEYLITAKFKFSYIRPLLSAGMELSKIIDAINHRLLTELQLNVPSFDTIITLQVETECRIKYFTKDMEISRRKIES